MLKKLVLLLSQNNNAMTDYHDYLIVLSPPEHIIENVKKLKDFSYSLIGEYDSHYTQAHITIQYWPAKKPTWIEPLVPKLERELQTLPQAILNIDGFSFVEQQGLPAIYAGLKQTPLTDIWFKCLRSFFNRSYFTPYVTIAKNISQDALEKLCPHFKHIDWREQFKIDKLTILRRETIGYNKTYKVFKEIKFNQNLDFYEFTGAIAWALPVNRVNPQQICLF